MFVARNIESFDLPELQPYRTMRLQMEHRQQSIFVAEGEKVVRRLLESRFEVVSVLLPEKWFLELKPMLASKPEHIEVFISPKSLLETLTGFSMYQGLLAVGRIPKRRPLEEILRSAARPLLLAAVDGLSSAQNIGAIVRNCAAFGVSAFITAHDSSSPFLRRAVRASMGAVFQVPIFECGGMLEVVKELREKGISCVAAHPHVSESRPKIGAGNTIYDQDLTGDCCVFFGSEGFGISQEVIAACDRAAAIRMAPGVDSLNVASASAVFFYEAARQRHRSNGEEKDANPRK